MGLFNSDLKVYAKEILGYCEQQPKDPLSLQLTDVLLVLNYLKENFKLDAHPADYRLSQLLLAKGMRNKSVRLDTSRLDYQLEDREKNTLFEDIKSQLKQKKVEALHAVDAKYANGRLTPQKRQQQTALIRARFEAANHYLQRAKIKAQMSAAAIASQCALNKLLERLERHFGEENLQENSHVIAIRINLRAIQQRLKRHTLCNAKHQEGYLIVEEDPNEHYTKDHSLKTREEMQVLFDRVKKHLKRLEAKGLLKKNTASNRDILKYLQVPLDFAEKYFKAKNDLNYQYPTQENSELSKGVNKLVDRGIKLGVSGSACLLIGGILHFTPLAPIGTLLVIAGAAQSILCGFPASLYRIGNAVYNGSHGIAPRTDEAVTCGLLCLSLVSMGMTRLLPYNGALLKATNDSTKICLGTLGAIGVAGIAEGIIHQLEIDELDEDEHVTEPGKSDQTVDAYTNEANLQLTETALYSYTNSL